MRELPDKSDMKSSPYTTNTHTTRMSRGEGSRSLRDRCARACEGPAAAVDGGSADDDVDALKRRACVVRFWGALLANNALSLIVLSRVDACANPSPLLCAKQVGQEFLQNLNTKKKASLK
ncbi:unnamed protein product [Strongylus vulgaris]|uniref:Uncharacterized protein n=1 Tax=Strongylus vulgaris TaxID=40348 RepID=A0A3P7JJG4_STRVU|nr:unnamed protein product [Strongylus vulgaris]